MTKTLDAIYENGALRLLEPLELENGARVKIALETEGNGSHDVSQIENSQVEAGQKSPEEILAFFQEIAALPIEGKMDAFSGSDHDKVLYGSDGAA